MSGHGTELESAVRKMGQGREMELSLILPGSV